jgi:D-alanyl-D-alanine carboxypeptidase
MRSQNYESKLVCVAVLAGALNVLSLCACGQQEKMRNALARADDLISSQTAAGEFRGSVLVGIDGNIAFEKGYGYADEEWAAFNTPTTKFRIGSLTKQFTAACILLLQERGQLTVHDPVSKYVPDLPPDWRAITLHQLLTHTSGIPNYPGTPRIENTLNRTGATPREILEVVAEKPLEFKPGTRFHYTNTGYVLLGMVIEKISGVSYADFIERNIFVALSMKSSGYDFAGAVLSQRASGYMLAGGRVNNADFIDMSIPFAAGGIYSTVEDLYRWNEALANGKLLSVASTKQMFAVYPEAQLQGTHYGYGVVLAERFGKRLYYHGGGVKGFNTVIQRYPQDGVCIVILENLDPSSPWDVGDHIAALMFGQPAPAAH